MSALARRRGLATTGALALAISCTLPPAAETPAAAPAPAPALVYYPPGGCTAALEVEVFDRARERWTPHPEHPRLAPGACAREQPERLLNELRVRCVDPSGRRPPSDWVVGAELAGVPTPCAASD